MNPNRPHIALPLEWLFARLEAAGFAMDTSRKLRLLRALEREGPRYVGRWDDLKYLLAPFVARTAEEQRRFYEVYAEFQRECGEEMDRLFAAPAETAAETPPATTSELLKRYWWLLLAVAGLLTWVIIQISRPTPPAPVSPRMDKNVEAREDSVLQIANLTNNAVNNRTDTAGFRWEVRDAATGELEYADSTYNFAWRAADFGTEKRIILRAPENTGEVFQPIADTLTLRVQCSDPPPVDTRNFPASPLVRGQNYTFVVDTEPEVEVEWYGIEIDRQARNGKEVEGAFVTGGTATLRIRAYRPDHVEDCYTEITRRFDIGAEKPFLETVALQMDQPRQQVALARWYWMLLLVPFMIAGWLHGRWRRRRRAKPPARSAEELEAAYPIHDAGPYYVPYLPQNEKINVPPAFFRIADVLRRREAGIRRVFDATGSVRATTQSGGFPSWRDRPLTRPAEYLMLVRRTDERQQQDRLFQRLALFLQRRDAPVTIFYHDGRFERFRNERYPDGLPLHQLYRRYPDYRLVVVGDGHGLVNPYAEGKPALFRKPVAELQRWSRRLLITPEAPADWSYQEALLHRHLRVFPATTAGILQGVETLDRDEEYIPIPFANWQADMAAQYELPSGRYRTWDRIEDLRDFTAGDRDLYRWLRALAVTDQPDWALTIAIGRAIGVDVTHDRLLQLSRIPWLADNQMRNELRLALLSALDPADERPARRAVAEELERVKEKVEHSFAQSEWTANLAVQHFALHPRKDAHKQTIRDLRDLGLLSAGQLAELDQIVQERADTKGLPGGASRDLDAWLETPEPRPQFTGEWFLSAFFFLVFVGMALFGGWYNRQEGAVPADQELAFWQTATPLDDEALRLNNQAVGIGRRLDTLTSWTAFQVRGDSVTIADSLLAVAREMRPGGVYPLADSNQVSLRFSYAARRFNFFLMDSITAGYVSGTLPIGRDSLSSEPGNRVTLADPAELFSNNYSQTQRSQPAAPVQNQAGTSRPFGDYDLPSPTELQQLNILNRLSETFLLAIPQGEPNDARRLAALHGHGLTLYYRSQYGVDWALDSARQVRRELLNASDGLYFDSIRTSMPVNLNTLLDALPAGEEPPQNEYAEPATVNLTGRVLDAETRQPLPGVRIRAADANRATDETLAAGTAPGMITAITDPKGVYQLADVSTDIEELQIYALAPGGYESNETRSRGLQSIPDLLLAPLPAQSTPQQAQQTPPDNTLSGRVTDAATGEPLADVRVCDIREGLVMIEICIPTDVEGRYDWTIDDNLTGLSFHLEGYQSQRVSISGRKTINVQLEPESANASDLPPVPEPEMVRVPGGTFTMGCLPERDGECEDDELPAHEVRISTFYMSKFEVTNEEFAAFLNDYGSDRVKDGSYTNLLMIEAYRWGVQRDGDTWRPAAGYEQHPVVHVSWYGAYTYAQWLSEKTGKNYRLPTEAEWEYAARGGPKGGNYRYAGSNDPEEVAWYSDNAKSQTHSIDETVRTLRPNELGLYNMSGNVWEWCADWYDSGYYETLAKDVVEDPQGPENGNIRVLRGGSWGYDVTTRVAWRTATSLNPGYTSYYYGFRLSRAP